MYNTVSGDVSEKLLDKFKCGYALNSKYVIAVNTFLNFELELHSKNHVILIKVYQISSFVA